MKNILAIIALTLMTAIAARAELRRAEMKVFGMD